MSPAGLGIKNDSAGETTSNLPDRATVVRFVFRHFILRWRLLDSRVIIRKCHLLQLYRQTD
jgi:hypothetical protein